MAHRAATSALRATCARRNPVPLRAHSDDGLIIATGAGARQLMAAKGLAGVHCLRTLAIRAALEQRPRVAIGGAGFIGLEVAASCPQARNRGEGGPDHAPERVPVWLIASSGVGTAPHGLRPCGWRRSTASRGHERGCGRARTPGAGLRRARRATRKCAH